MTKIDPNKKYSIMEIIKQKLIPGVDTHAKVYNLITIRKKAEDDLHKYVNEYAEETTPQKIKPNKNNSPWNKISGKITVDGKELIKFLNIHNLL
jgi:hypothetical protein